MKPEKSSELPSAPKTNLGWRVVCKVLALRSCPISLCLQCESPYPVLVPTQRTPPPKILSLLESQETRTGVGWAPLEETRAYPPPAVTEVPMALSSGFAPAHDRVVASLGTV